MRISFLLLASLALVACGGSTVPPETAAATAASASASPPTDAPAASAAPSEEAAAPATPEPVRNPPTLAGALAGKPFHGVAACVAGGGKDPGKVYVEIYDVKDMDVTKGCGMLPAVPGARKIGVFLPWSEGAKLDVGALKASKDPEMFVMATTSNPKRMDRKDVGKDIKPKGTIEVLKAPRKKGDVGRIKLDLTAGKDKLTGEIDVDVIAGGLN